MASSTARVSQQKKDRFLEAYAELGTLTYAAIAAGCSRRSHYNWLEDDPDYAQRFRDAEDAAVDGLEQEAIRRAFAGSDTLLIFLLKGLRPDRYAQRTTVEVKQHADAGQLVDQARAKVLQYLPGGLSRGA